MWQMRTPPHPCLTSFGNPVSWPAHCSNSVFNPRHKLFINSFLLAYPSRWITWIPAANPSSDSTLSRAGIACAAETAGRMSNTVPPVLRIAFGSPRGRTEELVFSSHHSLRTSRTVRSGKRIGRRARLISINKGYSPESHTGRLRKNFSSQEVLAPRIAL